MLTDGERWAREELERLRFTPAGVARFLMASWRRSARSGASGRSWRGARGAGWRSAASSTSPLPSASAPPSRGGRRPP